jgi:intracellular sulfur oxidation DsrE/DsrF family protein
MKQTVQVLIVLLTTIFSQNGLSAEVLSNDNALTGNKETKAYFDVNVGEPDKLFIRLKMIETTYSQFLASRISPHFIIGIRGKASNYFTKDNDYVLDVDIPVKKKIASMVDQFKAKGIRMEQCSLAARMQEISIADFHPLVEVVSNGYASMIVYQSQGYAFVPMD